jgi:hypothetical protein
VSCQQNQRREHQKGRDAPREPPQTSFRQAGRQIEPCA